MIDEVEKKHRLRKKRQLRVRKHVRGTATRPRMTVLKSNKHLHVQLIDDERGHTLAAVSTLGKEFRGSEFTSKSCAAGRKLGEVIGAMAIKQNIKEIVFDRGPYRYHGILAELADGARGAGLQF